MSECPENDNNELKQYVKNILKSNLDFNKTKNDTNAWKVTLTIFEALRDDTDSKTLAGFPIFFQSAKWYTINIKSLKSSLNVYIVSTCTPFGVGVRSNLTAYHHIFLE